MYTNKFVCVKERFLGLFGEYIRRRQEIQKMLEAEHGDRSGASEVISHGLESRKTSVSWITEQITSISFARRGRLATTGASN